MLVVGAIGKDTHGLLSTGQRRTIIVSRRFPRWTTHHPIPPRNIYKILNVRGDFYMSAQVPNGRPRPSRVGNHHRDDVTIFRLEVFDHHANVRDVRLEIPMTEFPRCFVATAKFPNPSG